MIILGISVGTYRTGIAVLQDGTLKETHIYDHQEPWSDSKLHVILNRYQTYFRKYALTDIIVKVPPACRHTNALKRLIRRIEVLAKENYCDYDFITKTEIKGTLNLKTTAEIIQYTTLLYPQLTGFYKKGLLKYHVYHKRLFEAVIAAHIYQERQRVRIHRIE